MLYGCRTLGSGTGWAMEQILSYATIESRSATYLGVFELLLNVIDKATTYFADEAPEEQLRSDFACPCNRSTDTQQGPYPVRLEVTDT